MEVLFKCRILEGAVLLLTSIECCPMVVFFTIETSLLFVVSNKQLLWTTSVMMMMMMENGEWCFVVLRAYFTTGSLQVL
jgi:hypothetical protein